MVRLVTAAALIALTLVAWDVPDCPFCQHTAHYASHSTDQDFFFLEPEESVELKAPAVELGEAEARPICAPRATAQLVLAPKHDPPAAPRPA